MEMNPGGEHTFVNLAYNEIVRVVNYRICPDESL
jgi:hypothetical protein